jgi:hypothetical protein
LQRLILRPDKPVKRIIMIVAVRFRLPSPPVLLAIAKPVFQGRRVGRLALSGLLRLDFAGLNRAQIRLTHTQQNPQNLLTGVLLVLLRHTLLASTG